MHLRCGSNGRAMQSDRGRSQGDKSQFKAAELRSMSFGRSMHLRCGSNGRAMQSDRVAGSSF